MLRTNGSQAQGTYEGIPREWLRDNSFVYQQTISYDRILSNKPGTSDDSEAGVGIELKGSERRVNLGALNWRRLPTGGHAAIVSYVAERSEALRIGIDLSDFSFWSCHPVY